MKRTQFYSTIAKQIYLFNLIILLFAMNVKAQFPAYVSNIESKPDATVEIQGNLDQGRTLDDLSWAWSSQNACFPGTQAAKFTGNHVFYAVNLPPHAILTVTLVPKDKHANMSLYGYQIGSSNYSMVPELSSCVSCEADYKWDYPHRGQKQDHTRSVTFNAIQNPYNVVIGVVGAEGLKTGDYTLYFSLEGGSVDNSVQQEVKVQQITCKKGSTTTISGNLSEGVPIHDLSWAWSSQNACFVGTQAHKFSGNHVLYTCDIPTYSVMHIKVIPKNRKDNFSLYAYEIGVGTNRIVPDLDRCVTCEADFKWDYAHRNQKQDHTRSVKVNAINNPYQVVIGIAGADDLTEGDFTLEITITDR